MDRHAQHHPRSRACVLPNGLRLHLAHDPAASRAAAWLRVAAGSHDEPSAHPGLAHFLEHLSFLGGAAFPGDERLMPWLQVRGGQVNASTRGRTTDYFFEVTAEHLGAGLARLIDMLARPLLDIDAQRREREVLEAEYLARSADEQTLIDAALALGLPAGHPCGVSLPGAATAWPWRAMRSSGPCANSMPPTITPAIASYGCKGRRHWTSWRGWRSVPAPTCRGARQARVRRRRRCCPSPAKRWRCACRDLRGWCWALPSTLCGDRRTDPAGVRRIARRSLAGWVAGGTRRTGPGRIGGAAGGSSGRAAGAPGVDLRTVRRQRAAALEAAFSTGWAPCATMPPACWRRAVAGGALRRWATTPARSRPAGGDSPGLPGRAARRPLPAAAPGRRTRRRRSALVGGLPPERGAGCRSAAADRAAACLALRTAVAAQCRRRGRAVPALALSRCARTVTLPGAAPGVASAVRPGAPGEWRWAWRRSAKTGR